MKVQEKMRIRNGDAVFTALEHSVWDVRQAAKQAVLAGNPIQGFVVTHEEQYYPRCLDQILSDESRLDEEVLALGENIVGNVGGRLRCAALWDMDGRDGILLHRDGNALLCAYIPVITQKAASTEHALALKLVALAEEVKDTPIHLDCDIPHGRWKLHKLLHYLSEQMEV